MNIQNKILLVGRDGRPSNKEVYVGMTTKDSVLLVRRRLKKTSKEYYRKYSNNKTDTLKKVKVHEVDFTNSIIIRWGNRIEIPLDNCIVYNKSEAIANATDKKKARIMLEKAGVTVPKMVTRDNFKNEDLPIIARPANHSKGRNLIVLKDFNDFVEHWDTHHNLGWYYSAFVNKDREFRVHCAHGKVLAIMEKPAPKDKSVIAWNRAVVNEEWTAIKWSDYKAIWCQKAIEAIKALSLDFGAVDVLVVGKKAYICEVNTSPTLISSPYVTQRYQKYFDWLFRSNTRREHWDTSKFTAGESFAWKNNQLLETHD